MAVYTVWHRSHLCAEIALFNLRHVCSCLREVSLHALIRTNISLECHYQGFTTLCGLGHEPRMRLSFFIAYVRVHLRLVYEMNPPHPDHIFALSTLTD
ncbi:hypothetical protein E2C01_073501 [Portunus trituberculatus]|uniref:Uncharacterized protein n=1 Tax=Portunus trituberculatus TaxID=210409 RepID=A0A5B7I379_PORTR|nr:hypothetical protein [Portunus trituberculatus]